MFWLDFCAKRKDCAVHTPSGECSYGVPAPIKQRDGAVQQGGDWKKVTGEIERMLLEQLSYSFLIASVVIITFQHSWAQVNKYVTVAIVFKKIQ